MEEDSKASGINGESDAHDEVTSDEGMEDGDDEAKKNLTELEQNATKSDMIETRKMFECLKTDISASVKRELKAELATDIRTEVENKVAASQQLLSARCDRLEALCHQQQKVIGNIPAMIDTRLAAELDQRDHQVAIAVQTVQLADNLNNLIISIADILNN